MVWPYAKNKEKRVGRGGSVLEGNWVEVSSPSTVQGKAHARNYKLATQRGEQRRHSLINSQQDTNQGQRPVCLQGQWLVTPVSVGSSLQMSQGQQLPKLESTVDKGGLQGITAPPHWVSNAWAVHDHCHAGARGTCSENMGSDLAWPVIGPKN